MLSIIAELNKRNKLLSLTGWICWLGVFFCMVMAQTDHMIVTGINAWIKPMKFFASVAIYSWSMAWILVYLHNQSKVKAYSRMSVIVMAIELGIITFQAANGRTSHFNISTPLNGILFSVMGAAIVTLTVWTGYIAYLFFQQKTFTISDMYVWGIRLGLIFFVLFSFEGGLMVQRMAHTVGGVDGSPGLPFFNWSREYGDLRVSHFFGIHALQILPIMGARFTTSRKQLFLFAALYFILVVVFLVQAYLVVSFLN